MAVTIDVPGLVAVNDAMLPEPDAARPIPGVVFVQLNVVPSTAPVKFTAAVGEPLHKVWLEGATTVGVGFTVIVKLCEGPVQVLVDGVTVMVAVTAAVPRLIAVNEAMFPEPEAARPMPGVVFVQLNVVAGTLPLKVTAVVGAPLHNVWLEGAVTLGVGFTVILKLCEVPVQLLAVGVTVIVAVTAAVPRLVAVNDAIFPEPEDARPILEVVFVQL